MASAARAVSVAAGPQKVFVLYSWKDRVFVDRVVQMLRRRGFKVGQDTDTIKAGDQFENRIVDLIEQAETILFILSQHSLNSQWCRWEVGAIHDRDKRVVPLLIGDVEAGTVPDYLSHLNYVVMTDPSDKDAFESLVQTLEAGRGISWSKRGKRIFLSYRRQDNGHAAGRIYDALEQKFGARELFFDIEDINFGDDFRDSIKQAMIQSRVMVAVVGKNWCRRRPLLDFGRNAVESDWVLTELEEAIRLNVKIVPLLVDNAWMPSKRDLPRTLSQFPYLNAAPIRAGRDFRSDIGKIVTTIDRLRKEPAPGGGITTD